MYNLLINEDDTPLGRLDMSPGDVDIAWLLSRHRLLQEGAELILQIVDGGNDPDYECRYCGNLVSDGHTDHCAVPAFRSLLRSKEANDVSAKQPDSAEALAQRIVAKGHLGRAENGMARAYLTLLEEHRTPSAEQTWLESEHVGKGVRLMTARIIELGFPKKQEGNLTRWLVWLTVLGKRTTMVSIPQDPDTVPDAEPPAIPMVLYCPGCCLQHIDTGEWATARLHRTHLCKPEDGGCGLEFRPANVSTVGVKVMEA